MTRRTSSKSRGVSLWSPNAQPGSSHSGHLTPLQQPSHSPRAPPAPCNAPYRRSLGSWTRWASQGMQGGHCRPRGWATLPGDRPPPRLTPCRWKPSPPAGCSLLAPSPMAVLSLCCVAWSRGGRATPSRMSQFLATGRQPGCQGRARLELPAVSWAANWAARAGNPAQLGITGAGLQP